MKRDVAVATTAGLILIPSSTLPFATLRFAGRTNGPAPTQSCGNWIVTLVYVLSLKNGAVFE